jgi:hypothetical protein
MDPEETAALRPGSINVKQAERSIMKALVKTKAEPGLWLEEAPEPKSGSNGMLPRIDPKNACPR